MSVRAKIFMSVAEIAVVITAVNLVIILFFAWNRVAPASGDVAMVGGMSSLKQVFPFKYYLAAAFLLAFGLLASLSVSRKLAKSVSGIEEQNARLREMNSAVKSMSEERIRFYANMRRDMREPLNSVIRLCEHMAGKEENGGEVRKNIGKIHDDSLTLLGVINNSLGFSDDKENKSVELMPVEYDVPSLINDIVTLNSIRIGDGPITFDTDIDRNLPRKLLGDDLRVELVCNNLLANALRFTQRGTIGMSVSHKREGISERLIIRISNTGAGFKPEELKEFLSGGGKFKKAEHDYSIAEMTVIMMGGTIVAESEYGKGSSFTACIPQGFVTDAVIGDEIVENLKRFQYRGRKQSGDTNPGRVKFPGARVLVVDDVEANLDVARELFKPYGIWADCLSNGWKAIDLIRDGKTRYDAIFMDHMMPDIDGISAVRVIRERIGTKYAQNVPIIALTASAYNGEEEMFLEKGFQALLPKPIDPVKLDEIVYRWLWEKNGAETSVPAALRESEPDSASLLWSLQQWPSTEDNAAYVGLVPANALIPA